VKGAFFTGHNIRVVLVDFFQASTAFPSSRLWPPDAITTRLYRTNPPILKWNFNFFAPAERVEVQISSKCGKLSKYSSTMKYEKCVIVIQTTHILNFINK